MQETQVQSLGLENPLEKGMATHSSIIIAWRISWTEEPGRLQSMELQRVGHNWASNTYTHTHTQTHTRSCKESDTTENLTHIHTHTHARTRTERTYVSSLVCVLPDPLLCMCVQRMFTYTDHGARPTGSESQLCYSLAVWPWASYLKFSVKWR